jgi:hypothetical protein
MQSRDRLAAGPDEQARNERVYEASQRGAEQGHSKSQGVALMLQIRLPHRSGVVEE